MLMESMKINERWQLLTPYTWLLKSGVQIWNPVSHKNLEAQGAVGFCQTKGALKINEYVFFNSPIHNLIIKPTTFLYQPDQTSWVEYIESDENEPSWPVAYTDVLNVCPFSIIKIHHQQTKITGDQLIVVSTEIVLPDDYQGPQYKKRLIYFDKKTLFIRSVQMYYQDGSVDQGDFWYKLGPNNEIDQNREQEFEIWWDCQAHGPEKRIISFAP